MIYLQKTGERLRSLVLHQPFWYVQVSLQVHEGTGRHFLSCEMTQTLKVYSHLFVLFNYSSICYTLINF